jgi:putative MFS transporter
MGNTVTETPSLTKLDRMVLFTVLVAALGYFIDIFDLLLFSIVRVQSLKDLGVAQADLLSAGITLINVQMGGLLIGGILWGVLGDRLGRVSVLFGSILLYSIANIANGFVTTVYEYAALRFLAGIGLAGELGAGVTLASELLPTRLRGLGTTFIASIGVAGAMVAATLADLTSWRTAYMVGGGLGLCLLAMRLSVRESGMYRRIEEGQDKISRGNVLMLFSNRSRLKRYLAVILVGAPLWGMVGLFISFTPEFAKAMGMPEPLPTAGKAVFYSYFGLVFGDALIGLLSQKLQSRRKAVAIALCLLIVMIGVYVGVPGKTLDVYYTICFFLGLSCGYWAMFVQMGAEQFGTNIRATAATTMPNFVRGLTIPITAAFHGLIPLLGVTGGGVAVMAVLIVAAFGSLFVLDETFGKDLDYIER